LWYCPICKKVYANPDDDAEHEEFHITYKMPCEECGQELTYCPECDAYHHTDSFEAEHADAVAAGRAKRKYLVTVTDTRVETWEVEASSPDDAATNYEDGELISEDTHREVSEVQEIQEQFNQ